MNLLKRFFRRGCSHRFAWPRIDVVEDHRIHRVRKEHYQYESLAVEHIVRIVERYAHLSDEYNDINPGISIRYIFPHSKALSRSVNQQRGRRCSAKRSPSDTRC